MQIHHCLWVAAALLTGCASEKPRPVDSEIIAAAQAWGAAYDSRDPRRIAAAYAADATFWGTTMKAIATRPEAVFDYFKDAASRPNARVRFDSHHVSAFGNVATDSGAYTFTNLANGVPVSNPARFTMVFQLREGRWVLVHHHSSAVP